MCFSCLQRFSFSYLAYSVQSVAGLWISSSWNHELKDVECKTNITQTEFELIKTQCYIVSIYLLCQIYLFISFKYIIYYLKPNLSSYCTSISVFICFFLMVIIFARRHTPLLIKNELHSLLLIDYLTAAADIVDFAEYSNNELITESVGIDLIWGII
jgi:hypothetical protein